MTIPSERLTEVIMVDGPKTATFRELDHSRSYTVCVDPEMVADALYLVDRECVACMTQGRLDSSVVSLNIVWWCKCTRNMFCCEFILVIQPYDYLIIC